jgi:hypothetical protein
LGARCGVASVYTEEEEEEEEDEGKNNMVQLIAYLKT